MVTLLAPIEGKGCSYVQALSGPCDYDATYSCVTGVMVRYMSKNAYLASTENEALNVHQLVLTSDYNIIQISSEREFELQFPDGLNVKITFSDVFNSVNLYVGASLAVQLDFPSTNYLSSQTNDYSGLCTRGHPVADAHNLFNVSDYNMFPTCQSGGDCMEIQSSQLCSSRCDMIGDSTIRGFVRNSTTGFLCFFRYPATKLRYRRMGNPQPHYLCR